ncbi:unnamed protein product [Owenia fusiformis]|uniref:TOG domain-containing protein n=1 Tax=Owenia fusiformis TaxID=6347 RepID=A0A8J1U5K4_OWEFU|nr:unnamed protein product [Owenia fusiformis]
MAEASKMEGEGQEVQKSQEVLQNLTRYLNSIGDDNRNTRKRALESIRKETLGKKPPLDKAIFHHVFVEISKPILSCLSDPVEKCRELSGNFIQDSIKLLPCLEEFLPLLIPVFVQRLGQQDLVEQSEEIRLVLLETLTLIVKEANKRLAVYLDDMVTILRRTIVDPFPDVKKESCKCASALAKATQGHFHMQSESLIPSLIVTVTHQHSRVRAEAVTAIGSVIQYGNGKSFDDVASHLAQRLFDHAPAVRIAVIDVVGTWMLDLMDRYSFWHKLIPLLLSGYTDELPEIQEKTDAYWHDTGIKYEKENPDDMKEMADFAKPAPQHYPSDTERPNLGCRQLMYRNISKIIPALIRDMGDWVVDTRIKASQLLYHLLLSEEEYIVQHLEKLLTGMYKACHDEEKEILKNMAKCAELLGYFVPCEVWCKLILSAIRSGVSFGKLVVLHHIILGSQKDPLKAYLNQITDTLLLPDVCAMGEDGSQLEVVKCAEALCSLCGEDVDHVAPQLFEVLITVYGSSRQATVQQQALVAVDFLGRSLQLDRQGTYERFSQGLLQKLYDDHKNWTIHSDQRKVFDALLTASGPVAGSLLDTSMPIIFYYINPTYDDSRDPELTSKFYSLLGRLMTAEGFPLNSADKFGDFAVQLVKEVVIPNCVWHAGKTQSALRATAVATLWEMMKQGYLPKEKMLEVVEDLLTQLLSLLTDDRKTTRLLATRCVAVVLEIVNTDLEPDRLHQIYPEFLKRLDDSSDDVRICAARMFPPYFACFHDYQVGLYRAHLEEIYKGLLVHLDDPQKEIQDYVLDALKSAAPLAPSILMDEIEKVKHKHRGPEYCNKLTQHIQSLSIS